MTLDARMPFAGEDERVRKYLYPCRVVRTWGKVEHAEQLVHDRDGHAASHGVGYTVLENGEDGEEAGVLLDFGTELHGGVRLISLAKQSEVHYPQVRLCFGESVAEACSEIEEKNASNDNSMRDFEVGIPNFSDQEFGETGFRFLCIRLKTKSTLVRLRTVQAVCIYRDMEYVGSFRCSNPRLNEIYDTAAYTCHLTMQRQLWDGLKRDRAVWMGDMHPEVLTVRTVFGTQKVITDTIDSMRKQTPLPGWMNGMQPYSFWYLRVVYDWYMFTGDEAFWQRNSAYVAGLIRQILTLVDEEGIEHYPGSFSDWPPAPFLDWPTAGRPESICGVRGLFASTLLDCVELCKLLEDAALGEACQKTWQALERLPSDPAGAKQVAAMLSLSGLRDARDMAAVIFEDGAKGLSTFMSYYILKAAAAISMPKALQLLEVYYGGMLDMGATTFWEDFNIEWMENAGRIDEIVPEGMVDIHGDKGAFCYRGLRHSLCHGWSSGPAAFLAEEVLGIHIEEAGCRRIRLQPQLGDLEWAEGTYPTPLGVLTVSCRRQADGTIKTEYTAPAGMEVALV